MTRSNARIAPDTIQSAQAGDADAMWQIVTVLEPMLRGIVRAVAGDRASREDAEDLMQEARCALITRVASYETDSGTQLQTHAYMPAYGAVAAAWTRCRPGITVEPSAELAVRRALAEAGGDVESAFAALRGQSGHSASMSRATFNAVVAALAPVADLHGPAREHLGGALTLAETLADPEDRGVQLAESRDLAEFALRSVTARRALVLRATYGVGMPPMEDAEIGGHLGNVTPTRVRRIRFDGIQQARAALAGAA